MANPPLVQATILAEEVIQARSSPGVLLELLQRADPFLRRMAEKHKRYHAWDDVMDIHQEYRESFVRCIHKYDVSRAFDGRGFVSFLNWQIRTDYRSHHRRLDAEYSVRNIYVEVEAEMELTDMEPYFQKALRALSEKDRIIFIKYINGESVPGKKIDQIQREIRSYMMEDGE